jgi:hypothetical protein
MAPALPSVPVPAIPPNYPGHNQVSQAVNLAILTLDTDPGLTTPSQTAIVSLLAAVTVLLYNPGVTLSS